MRKFLTMFVLIAVLTSMNVVSVFADETLDTILNGQEQTEEQGQGQGVVSGDTGKELIDSLGKAADVSDLAPEAVGMMSGVKRVVGIAVQIISYIITFGLTLRIVMDLMYIGLPFSRKLLANGYTGNAGQPQQGMAGGMNGGFGGMNGGFGGMSRPGYGGMGYGSGMGYGGMQSGMGQQPQQQGMGLQLVSNAALNAVASETQMGPSGQSMSPFKIYIKDMVVVLVIVPILLILATTGVLAQLGFAVGGVAANIIGSISGSL